MAVVARTVTQLSHTTPLTMAAAPGAAANVPDGDTFLNNGAVFVVISNTHATIPYDVTEYVASTVDGLTVTGGGRVWEIPALTSQLVKLGPPKIYGSPTKLIAENVAVKFAAYRI